MSALYTPRQKCKAWGNKSKTNAFQEVMAIIWYDESMPYCELEPLGVVRWERRKGIAAAILHEAANRNLMIKNMRKKYSDKWFSEWL